MTQIRVLTEHDAPAFWQLRLEALEQAVCFRLVRRRTPRHHGRDGRGALRSGAIKGIFVLGAFVDGELAGTAGFRREDRAKTAHKGWIWGVYVTARSRGQGIGRALLVAVLQQAQLQPGLEQIHLSVAVDGAAQRLYSTLGFQTYALEPHALKIGASYSDQNHMVLRVRPGKTD